MRLAPRTVLAATALSLAFAAPGLAEKAKPAPKPKMTVTQITQDSAGLEMSTAVIIGLAVIVAVALSQSSNPVMNY